jgi:hypothetical protein
MKDIEGLSHVSCVEILAIDLRRVCHGAVNRDSPKRKEVEARIKKEYYCIYLHCDKRL